MLHASMPSVNPHTRELVFKLVFYGPGLGGKTTTLQYIHAATRPEHRGKMVSLATPTDRTLYFDFLPVRLPRVRGMAVRLQLFTVPGQVYYAATRKLVLNGADGIVFVADSQSGRGDVNQESLDDLHANLKEQGRTLDDLPHTFQWNKRDLGDLASIEELDRRFNKLGAPSIGTVATRGDGVFEGLERITRLVLKAYETDPKVRIEATAGVMENPPSALRAPDEDAVADALRGLEASGRYTGESPTRISGVLPELERGASADELVATSRATASGGREMQPTMTSVGTMASAFKPAKEAPAGRPPTTTGEVVARGAFSFAELWPDADRDAVLKVEGLLAARDGAGAVLACDALLTRLLASAAGLLGAADAPRDPAVVTLLLGLEGPRYFAFRSLVRAARNREPVDMKDALDGFSFVLEARRARDLARR